MNTENPVVVTSHPNYSPKNRSLYRGTQVVWYLASLIEVILAARFVLKLLAANPGAGFSDFIYTLSYPFVAPFRTVFGSQAVQGSVFEWSTLLAMLVYWLIAWAIVKLFVISKPVSNPEASAKLDQQE